MAEARDYQDIPEDQRKRAKAFFDKAKVVADTGNYDYAIEMYLQGLAVDPEEVAAHQLLREYSLKRRATGGKSMGMFDAMKLKRPTKDDKTNMLNAEKLLAYEPGNTDYLVAILQNAQKAGFYETVLWVGPLLLRANADSPKPDFNKFIILKDAYKAIRKWKEATEAAHYALRIKPDDMDLQTELKNLGAQHTMTEGNYESDTGNFRKSLRDADSQQKLMDDTRDVRSMDFMTRAIAETREQYDKEPNETGKINKYVDALVKTEQTEYENVGLEALEKAFERSNTFSFRKRIGEIKIAQLKRMERSLKKAYDQNKTDKAMEAEYQQFKRDQIEFELEEFKLMAENYPTEMKWRFEVATRMFQLRRFDEAIPMFQHARQDPKLKTNSLYYLGRAFLEAGFPDESIETLQGAINDYQGRGDDREKSLNYWLGRALEMHGAADDAIKAYSRVAQMDFNYLDVQSRIKKLREKKKAGAG